MTNRFIGCLCGLLMLAVPTASHAVVIYDESFSGDLPGVPTTVLDFVVGTNTILGSSEYSGNNSGTTSDFDAFAFNLPSGSQLTNVLYAFSATVAAGTGYLDTDIALKDTLNNFLDHPTVAILGSSPVSLFGSVLPLAAGQYQFVQDGAGTNGASSGYGGTWDYEITFDVSGPSAVPLPAALPLYGTGLGLMGLFGWWRRRKAAAAAV